MSMRINSFSYAPVNSNINKTNKPNIAFGDGYTKACMDTLHALKQRFTSETVRHLRNYALEVPPEDKIALDEELRIFLAQKDIKPILAKAVDTIFGVKIEK